MASDWYYLCGGQMVGPLTNQELRDQAVAGQITPEVPVRRGTEGNWTLAKKVKGLCSPTPNPLPPQPPPAVTLQAVGTPTPHQPRPALSLQPASSDPPYVGLVVAFVGVVLIGLIAALVLQDGPSRSAAPDVRTSSSPRDYGGSEPNFRAVSEGGLTSSPLAPASKMTKDNFLKITNGMTTSDVRLILGQPHDTNEAPRTVLWMWNEGNVKVRVRFTNTMPMKVEHKWQDGL